MNDYCDIFISYRRKGGLQMDESLYEWLTVKKGFSVFFDKKSLREGRWDKELRRQVRLCKDFLLIVDKHLFDRMFDSTYPKEEELVRQELYEVIILGDDVVNIIPIVLPKAVIPKVLPDDIGTINKWNWISIENKYDLLNKCEELKNRLLVDYTNGCQKKKAIRHSMMTSLFVKADGIKPCSDMSNDAKIIYYFYNKENITFLSTSINKKQTVARYCLFTKFVDVI